MILVVLTISLSLAMTAVAHGEGTFIPAPGRRDIAHDHARNLLYITSGDQVLRYDLATDEFRSPIVLGGSLWGVDISADCSTLAVADSAITGSATSGASWIHIVDLETGTSKKAEFERGWYEGGTYDVAFTNEGQILVTPNVLDGWGWDPLRLYDPATDIDVTLRRVQSKSVLSPGADRGVVAYSEPYISSGDWGRYRAADDSLVARTTQMMNSSVAVDRNDQRYAVRGAQDVRIYDGNLAYSRTHATRAQGIAYSPAADVLYVSLYDQPFVRAYDAYSGALVGQYDFEANFYEGGFELGHAEGLLKPSWAGDLLFATVEGGVRYVPLGAVMCGNARSSFHDLPIPSARVELWRYDETASAWSCETTITARTSGAWNAFVPGTGAYRLRIVDPLGYHEPTWYGGLNVESAEDVTPAYHPQPSDVMMPLVGESAIQGRVTGDDGGLAAAAVRVTLYDAVSHIAYAEATTDGDGRYAFTGILPHTYHIGFNDPSDAHYPEYATDKDSLSSASEIVTQANSTTTVDSVLRVHKWGSIAGRVTSDDGGRPLGGVRVTVYDPESQQPVAGAVTTTTIDGTYVIGDLEPGGYFLGFQDSTETHFPEWHLDHSAVWWSDEVTVVGDEVTAIDAVMRLRPCVRGHVYDAGTAAPLAGVKVLLFDAQQISAGQAPVAVTTVTTAPDGSYRAFGLLEDKAYVVAFSDPTGVYRDITWPGSGRPLHQAEAVVAKRPTSGVDGHMQRLDTLANSRVQRVAGTTRYETALQISRTTFQESDAAILVSGEQFPDALSAAPLAGAYSAPILLTRPTALPPGLTDELRRLRVTQVIIVGGARAVSGDIERQLDAGGFSNTTRIAGMNRYDTSARVASAVIGKTGTVKPFICRGDEFADALSAAPFAYMQRRPILLVQPKSVSPEVGLLWQSIHEGCENSVLVVGGTSAITPAALEQLRSYTWRESIGFDRLSGADRYATCAALIRALGSGFDTYGIASGVNYPDALTGAAATGHLGAPLLLTSPNALSSASRGVLREGGPYVMRVRCFGGTAALSIGIPGQVRDALGSAFYDIDTVVAGSAPR